MTTSSDLASHPLSYTWIDYLPKKNLRIVIRRRSQEEFGGGLFHESYITEEHEYSFAVSMTCSGCEKAVRKALLVTPGVIDFHIRLPEKQVSVLAVVPEEDVQFGIEKSGKAVIPSRLVGSK